MCSIFGIDTHAIAQARLRACFDRTVSRGPDLSRFEEIPIGYLGFHRLSIMGLDETGMQPFHLNGNAVVCNGELYGFRAVREKLRQKYGFESDSDCEILLPLYEQYGLDMFAQLDAEFALILYDSKTKNLVAASDPIGIRPLYYGKTTDDRMAFASEPKNLMGLCERVMPFPPGCYWAMGRFVRYADPSKVETHSTDDEAAACARLRELLIAGVQKRMDADAPMGFLLSGGLDSSLVCAIAQKLSNRPIRTFAIGMDTDAIDLKYARKAADFIGSEHTEVIMTQKDVCGALKPVADLLATYDITTIRASIGMYLVCKYIHERTDVRVIMTGEISDELFGYKYTDFAPNPEAFEREAEKRIRELHMYDVLRADRCISVNSLEARVPFGDLAFVRYAMRIAPELKMNRHNMGKYLIRKAFASDHILPDEILWRQKAAFSDAVGHSMVDDLKQMAEDAYTDAEFEARRLRFDHARPFTKESLLYRELFENTYPGQSGMIAGFWMPNRAWKGCDVLDPSARVLSNYGDSGL